MACRSRLHVAGGSLVLETQGRAGSSFDNARTGRDYQTARVWLARRSGVRHRNQLWNPLKVCAGSNLVDRGRSAVHAPHGVGRLLWLACGGRPGGHGEGLRRSRGEAAGEELGAYPVEWLMVNVGTSSGPLPVGLPGRWREHTSSVDGPTLGRSPRMYSEAGKAGHMGKGGSEPAVLGLPEQEDIGEHRCIGRHG